MHMCNHVHINGYQSFGTSLTIQHMISPTRELGVTYFGKLLLSIMNQSSLVTVDNFINHHIIRNVNVNHHYIAIISYLVTMINRNYPQVIQIVLMFLHHHFRVSSITIEHMITHIN